MSANVPPTDVYSHYPQMRKPSEPSETLKPNSTKVRKDSCASNYTTSSATSSLSPESSQAEWSLAQYLSTRSLTFPAEQEQIYYEERLGPAALMTLTNGYSLSLVIILIVICLAVVTEQNMLALYALGVALVCNIVGLASVKWDGGKLFLRWYNGSGDSTKQANDPKASSLDEKGLPPMLGISRNASITTTNSLSSAASIAPEAKQKRKFSVRATQFVILTPLAVFFLALLVIADLTSLETALSVTGSSYSYIVLLSAAGMGVIFTHPVVWYPMTLAAMAVLLRCGLIIWSIFTIYTSGKMPLVTYGPNTSISTSAPSTNGRVRTIGAANPLQRRAQVADELVTRSSPLESLIGTIPGLQKRNYPCNESKSRPTPLRKRSEGEPTMQKLVKRDAQDVLNTSVFGRKLFVPVAAGLPASSKISPPLAVVAALGGAVMYLSSSIIAVIVALRFARSNERGHRVRFIQTKVVQQDRDRLTRERDRSARLLAIVFPKPVISNLLSLWAKNNQGINSSDAILQSQRSLDGNFEDSPTGNGNLGGPSNDFENNLEFADRINNVVVAFVDFYTTDVFAGIGGQDGGQDKCQNSRAHARRAVALLNLTFEKFDAILEKYPGVEKIKTIGTKVMIAGGLFDSKAYSDSANLTMSKTGVIDRPPLGPEAAAAELTLLMLRLALETLNTMSSYDPRELDECFEYEAEYNDNVPCTCTGNFSLNSITPRCVRFGIASGTVVAGIVGLERFCLDLWGDSVNTASRMLSVAAKNEVVVTEEVRGGFQYLQSGKMAKVLGMVEVKDDFLFESLGTRDIKGKGPMELFYVTNPWYDNYMMDGHNPAPSVPFLPRSAPQRNVSVLPRAQSKTPRKKRINATADLVSAALGLARDVEKSNANAAGKNMDGTVRTSLLRRSLMEGRKFRDPSAEDSNSRPGRSIESIRRPKSYSPLEGKGLPTVQENVGRYGETPLHSSDNLKIAVGDSQDHYSIELEPEISKDSMSATYDYISDIGLANVRQPGRLPSAKGIAKAQTRGQRLSVVISDLSPANNTEAAESWDAHVELPEIGSDGSNDLGVSRDNNQPDANLSTVISDILHDFLSMPTSELSYDRQFSMITSHLHRWLLRFTNPGVERWYRSVRTSERKSLELLWDGCLASVITFGIASAEIFLGGAPSVTMDNQLKLFVAVSKPTFSYWIAAAGLILHISAALFVSWEGRKQQKSSVQKKMKNRRAVLKAGQESRAVATMARFANSSDPSQQAQGAVGNGRLLSALQIFLYHVATLSFFLTVTALLIDTPIGDRSFFAPALLVTCTFYAVQLDIGAPSFIRASLWTAFLLVVSCISLMLRKRLTYLQGLVISSFGFLTFLFLARATQRARRTGFLLRVVVDKQKSLSAGEARRSAQLLMSILPERILRRVIDDPRAMVVEEFAAVTFLHLDVVDFTAMSAALAPDAVVSLLNVLFTKFDEVCRRYGVEKMTTIGDAYVAFGLSASAMEGAEAGLCSGVDEEYVPIALETCKAALELQHVVDEFNRSDFAKNLLRPSGKSGVRVRVAVHTGRGHGCVLGGTTRLKYEFVGEAIRVAERVQEKTPKGQACVSEASVRKMGQQANEILQYGRGVIDGIYMEVEQDQVDGMNYFVMTKLNE